MSLTVGQYQNLGTTALTKNDMVTLADTGSALGNLSAGDIAGLRVKGIDKMSSTTTSLSLNLDQFNALGTVILTSETDVTVTGTSDNDMFSFYRQTFGEDDSIVGGAGTGDNLTLNGDYSAGLHVGANSLSGVERMTFAVHHSYKVTTDDANVDAGQKLLVNGSGLHAGDSLIFDGSAETNGTFSFRGGSGTSTFTGGSGADGILGGAGADAIRYTEATQSVSLGYGSGYDTVTGFNGGTDRFELWTGVTYDGTASVPTLNKSSFNANLEAAASSLAIGHAAIFTAATGTLAGAAFLLVNTDGVAGYQGGSDLIVRLDAGAATTTSQSSFTMTI
jgi:hypothetical protein